MALTFPASGSPSDSSSSNSEKNASNTNAMIWKIQYITIFISLITIEAINKCQQTNDQKPQYADV